MSATAALTATPKLFPFTMRDPDADLKAWAASTLADLPTTVSFREDLEVETATLHGDKLYRRAFVIVVSPNGKRRFNINLRVGARIDDLETAENLIEDAKNGVFDTRAWKRRKDGSWAFSMWFRFEPGKLSPFELRPCTVTECVDSYHQWLGDEFNSHHSLPKFEHPSGMFSVHASLFEEEDGWQTWVNPDNDWPDGHDGLELLREMLAETERLQAECDRLNAIAGVSKR